MMRKIFNIYYNGLAIITSPIILFHELLHVVACLITNTDVYGFGIITDRGRFQGMFIFHDPKISFKTDILIAIAPILLVFPLIWFSYINHPLKFVFLFLLLTTTSDIFYIVSRFYPDKFSDNIFNEHNHILLFGNEEKFNNLCLNCSSEKGG